MGSCCCPGTWCSRTLHKSTIYPDNNSKSKYIPYFWTEGVLFGRCFAKYVQATRQRRDFDSGTIPELGRKSEGQGRGQGWERVRTNSHPMTSSSFDDVITPWLIFEKIALDTIDSLTTVQRRSVVQSQGSFVFRSLSCRLDVFC
jgi:hypothetical protein